MGYNRGLDLTAIGVTLVVLVIITFASVKAAGLVNGWVGVGVFVLILTWFFTQGLREIPAKPPHKGVVTTFGTRTRVVAGEGLNFFPLYPWVMGFIPVKVEKINKDFKDQKVRTTDLAEILVPVSITYVPGIHTKGGVDEGVVIDDERTDADYLNQYIDTGEKEGVENIIQDIINQNLREWAISRESGRTWKDTIENRGDAAKNLVERIVKMCDLIEEDNVSAEMHTNVLNGRARIPIYSLGITLLRLNLGEMEPTGELVKAAELEAVEMRQRDAEKVELKHVRRRALEIKSSLGISMKEAIDIVQTERSKVSREVKDYRLDQGAEDLIGRVLGRDRPRNEGGDS